MGKKYARVAKVNESRHEILDMGRPLFVKLKPCPFCGAPAKAWALTWLDRFHRTLRICCGKNDDVFGCVQMEISAWDVPSSPLNLRDDEDLKKGLAPLAEQWNTRDGDATFNS